MWPLLCEPRESGSGLSVSVLRFQSVHGAMALEPVTFYGVPADWNYPNDKTIPGEITKLTKAGKSGDFQLAKGIAARYKGKLGLVKPTRSKP